MSSSKGIRRVPNNYKRGSRRTRFRVSGSYSQTKLSSHRYNKADVKITLAVLKEVGKVICPPAALALDTLYFLYTHADAIKEAGAAIAKGDYKKAAKVVVKEGIKEVAGKTLSDNATKGITDESKKNIKDRVIKGAIKGAVEGAVDQAVDVVVDKAAESVSNE